MKSTTIAAVVAVCAFSAPVAAEDRLIDMSTAANVAAALQEAGYKAVIKTGDDGDPYISSAANGEEFTVDFYDCKDKHCTSISLSSWYKPDPLWTAALTNEWNAQKRFLRIGVDEKGKLREYIDISTVGKMTQANFADMINWYESMDAELARFIKEKRDAATPARPPAK